MEARYSNNAYDGPRSLGSRTCTCILRYGLLKSQLRDKTVSDMNGGHLLVVGETLVTWVAMGAMVFGGVVPYIPPELCRYHQEGVGYSPRGCGPSSKKVWSILQEGGVYLTKCMLLL